MSKILVFSGPSGGHLFPAQALAEYAVAQNPEISLYLVTSVRARTLCSRFPSGVFKDVFFLPEFGSPIGVSWQGVKAVLSIPVAIAQSLALLVRIRPDLCIGFGSFVSYFGMLFAVWGRIPTLVHEQNQVPGKATRMLQNCVNQIAASFPETEFAKQPKNVIVTGLPIRRDLREDIVLPAQKPSSPFTVLVCGGSQGSAFLNQAVLDAFSQFSPEERSAFAVIHITGPGQDERVRGEYAKMALRAEVYPFFEKMGLLYNRAHAAVSRAGANSGYEQALYGIPTVFIPYPFAEGHQIDNARFFVDAGAAVMFEQSKTTHEKIFETLRDWKSRDENYFAASRRMQSLATSEAHRLLWIAALRLLGK